MCPMGCCGMCQPVVLRPLSQPAASPRQGWCLPVALCSIGHGLGKGLCWDDVSSCVWNHRAVPGALRLLCGLFACAVPLGHQHSPS